MGVLQNSNFSTIQARHMKLSEYANIKDKIRIDQSWASAIWQKKQWRCAYRYSNKKVAPLPLLACKTAAAARCRCRYFKKNSKKNDGIQIRYLMMKFQLYLRKLIIQAFKIAVQVTIGISRLKW